MAVGSINNISSATDIIGTLDTWVYHASKRVVRIFTKAGYDHHIRIDPVHLGVIKTLLVDHLFKDENKMKTGLG